jgi:hypothetical protein
MSELKADKQAAELATKIKAAHEVLAEKETKQFRQSLVLAIDLGVLLNQAKATVYHGHFESWFEAQGFKFSYRSANRYMHLAKNREKLEGESNSPRVAKMAAEGDLSIRGAEALLKEEGGAEGDGDGDGDADDKDDEEDDDSPEAPSSNSADLQTVLANHAPDEVMIAIGSAWDYEQKKELLKLQLMTSSPPLLASILVDLWKAENLQALIKALNELSVRKPSADSTIPTVVRRDLAANNAAMKAQT